MSLSLVRKPVIQPLWAVTFSLHPAVPTQWYRLTASTALAHLQLPRAVPDQPSNFRSKSHLLDDCRRLLYTTYCRGMGWYPSPHSHTQFRMVDDDMLCDRYDEVGVWVAIVDPSTQHSSSTSPTKNPVLACVRILTGKLDSGRQGVLAAPDSRPDDPDLDILGYPDCPARFRQWVREQGFGRVVEGQRMAVARGCRGWHLGYHLYALAALPFLTRQQHHDHDSPLYDPTVTYLITPTRASERYIQLVGGKLQDPSWRMRYEKADALHPLPIYTVPVSNMWYGIQNAVRHAQETRQQQQRWQQQQSQQPTPPLPPASMIQSSTPPKLSPSLISRL